MYVCICVCACVYTRISMKRLNIIFNVLTDIIQIAN